MNIGWQYQREHLDPLHRSHSVIKNGGDQPNVVPSEASIWYYFRHVTYPKIIEVYNKANNIADGAALMTDTKVSRKVLGSAWPRHFNQVIAETMYENITEVGLPQWSDDDQALALAEVVMTLAISLGSSLRSQCAFLPTFLDCRDIIGPMRLQWLRRSHTKES